MSGPGVLLLVNEDGSTADVPNTYEGIKNALRGATMDGVRIDMETSAYINDNGIIEKELLNVPMSMWAGRPLYGPAVIMAARPDDEGNELPPTESSHRFALNLCRQWSRVLANMADLGQPPFDVRGDDTHMPPPTITMLSDADFAAWLEGRGR